jgi:hypothetical protein
VVCPDLHWKLRPGASGKSHEHPLRAASTLIRCSRFRERGSRIRTRSSGEKQRVGPAMARRHEDQIRKRSGKPYRRGDATARQPPAGLVRAHLTEPRQVEVLRDPRSITSTVRLWLVTDHTGTEDASTCVTYDAEENAFGLLTKLDDGTVRYLGPYGSLKEAVESYVGSHCGVELARWS